MKAQTSFEYVLLLAGLIIFVLLLFVLLKAGVLPEAGQAITNGTQPIASLRAGVP